MHLQFIFFLGFFLQFSQVVIFREILFIAPFIDIFTSFYFSIWMLWIVLGTYFSTKINWQNSLTNYLIILKIPSLIIVYFFIYLIKWNFSKINSDLISFPQSLLMIIATTLPIALLGGIELGVFFKTNSNNPSKIYRIEGIGALCGGILTSLCLGNNISQRWILIIFSLIFAMCLFLTNIRKEKKSLYKKSGQLILFLLFIFLIYFFRPLEFTQNQYLRNKFPNLIKDSQVESPIGRSIVLKDKSSNEYFFYQRGVITSLEKNLTSKGLIDFIMNQSIKTKNILVIGLHSYQLFDKILKYNINLLDTVDIDSSLITKIPLNIKHSKKIKYHFKDPRIFLNTSKKKWDLIIFNSRGPFNLLENRLLSKEFFQIVYNKLNSQGVFYLSIPTFGASHEYSSEILMAPTTIIYNSFKQIFKKPLLLPIQGHSMLAKKNGLLITDTNLLSNQLKNHPQAWPSIHYYNNDKKIIEIIKEQNFPNYFNSILNGILNPDFDFATNKKVLVSINKLHQSLLKFDLMNTDLYPLAVFPSLLLHSRISTEGLQFIQNLKFIHTLNLIRIIVIILMIISTIILIIHCKKNISNGNIPVMAYGAVSGFFAMTIYQIVIIHFQNLVGTIYLNIGLFSGVFMSGLVIGAWLAEKKIWRPKIHTIFLMMIAISALSNQSSKYF